MKAIIQAHHLKCPDLYANFTAFPTGAIQTGLATPENRLNTSIRQAGIFRRPFEEISDTSSDWQDMVFFPGWMHAT